MITFHDCYATFRLVVIVIVLVTTTDQTLILRNQPEYSYLSPPHIIVKLTKV